MDVHDGLLQLISPLALGDALLPGMRLVSTSIDLGLRLTFEVHGGPVHVELAPAGPEGGQRFAVRTSRVLLSYRSPPQRPVPAEVGLALCRAVATYVANNEAHVLDSLAGEAARASASVLGRARIREVDVTRFLERGEDNARVMYTANPYVGCLVGCRFCYAQSRTSQTRALEQLPALPWGSYTDVKRNAAKVLAAELQALPEGPIKFCPIVSDAYQPVERQYRVTRQCLEAIAASGRRFAPLILTRTALILDDASLLASIPEAAAGASIPTFDEEVRAHFEPRAITIAQRFAVLRALRAAGVRTFAVVQPMLPGPIDAFAEALAEVADSVSIDVLRSVEGATREFDDKRYLNVQRDDWQQQQAEALGAALTRLRVPLWTSDLPPTR